MTQGNLFSGDRFEEDQNGQQIRPQSFDDYVGQKKIKENMKIFVSAAKSRGESLDHCLFYGPPGLGKTTLAGIISNELGVNMNSTSGPAIEKSGDLAAILTNIEEGDVLFIDEIHRLHSSVEEILYPAMEDYNLDIIIGQGPAARTVKIDLPPFTLIGATTRAGLLTSPLRDRFGMLLRLEFYTDDELSLIVQRGAKILNTNIDKSAANEISGRSRGTPRIAHRILRRIRDFADVLNNGVINLDVAREGLERLEIDTKGLDAGDRGYLLAIMEKYDGGPVGVETLAATLSEDKDTLEDVIEPYLIYKGFIKKTPRGRVATRLAYEHMKKDMPGGLSVYDLMEDERG